MALSTVEQVKARINPYADRDAVLARLARGTTADITPEDDVVLRWHGLYRHRPQEDGVFMLRVKLPNGAVTASQLRAIAHMTAAGQDTVNLTTRQDIQIYGLTLAALPDAFAALDIAGLTSQGACGDVVRNVIGCPVAGLDPRETATTEPVAQALTAAFLGNPDFANLPRKFKIAVSGCADGCAPVQINDVGLVAAPNADGEMGFVLLVGGGLSAAPAFAQPLGWVASEQVVEVVTRLVQLFQAHGNRENRHQARVKHLVAARGLPWLRDELATLLGYSLPAAPPLPLASQGDHLGVHSQRETGRSYIGIPVPAGRLRGIQLAELAALAGGRIRITHHQNLILADIPDSEVPTALGALSQIGLPVEPDGWAGRLLTCPGKAVCLKALTQTKAPALALLAGLASIPAPAISLHVSGCPNGCAQHAIADIGLQGALEQGEERFDLWTGGGDGRAFAQRTLSRLRPDEIGGAIHHLLDHYHVAQQPGESFSAFARRVLWQEQASGLSSLLKTLVDNPIYL